MMAREAFPTVAIRGLLLQVSNVKLFFQTDENSIVCV